MPHNVWDEVPDWGGIGALRLDRADAGLGASVWELQPGASQFVYHFHHGSDELLVVLRVRRRSGCTTDGADDGAHHFHRTSESVEHAGPE